MELRPASASDRATCIAAIERVYKAERGGGLFFKRPGWIAVPYEEGGSIGGEYARRIAEVAATTGDHVLWLATGEETPRVFDVEPSAAAVVRARDDLRIYDVSFVSPSLRWLAIASEAEFGVLLGEADLVQQLAGFDPAEADARFSEYVAKWQRVPAVIDGVASAPWSAYESLPDEAPLHIRYW